MIRRAALALAALTCAACGGASEQKDVARYLVYTLKSGPASYTIWIGDVDGRNVRALTRGFSPLVSPDGSKIAFHSCREADDQCAAAEVSPRVYTISPDGGKIHFVTQGFVDAWFPDSKHFLTIGGNLVKTDAESGKRTVLARASGDVYGWSFSPSGDRIAYARVAKRSDSGICREQVDIFVAAADGKTNQRLTYDGRSSDPVWGDDRIAFARHPVDPKCLTPKAGLWTVRPDGTDVRPIVRRAPRRFAWNGYYGLRPHGWVSGQPLLVAGVLTEWGDELALVETRTGRIRRPDLDRRRRYSAAMYVDHVSADGRHVLGLACGAEYPCTAQIFSVPMRSHREVITGRVSSVHWNR